MTKHLRFNTRLDELTYQLMLALQESEDKSASAVVRSAVYWYAKEFLSEEEFKEAVDLSAMLSKLQDVWKGVKLFMFFNIFIIIWAFVGPFLGGYLALLSITYYEKKKGYWQFYGCQILQIL